jgi:hypothetical protein
MATHAAMLIEALASHSLFVHLDSQLFLLSLEFTSWGFCLEFIPFDDL